ncbi:unnamed protein product [Caretta caretta]
MMSRILSIAHENSCTTSTAASSGRKVKLQDQSYDRRGSKGSKHWLSTALFLLLIPGPLSLQPLVMFLPALPVWSPPATRVSGNVFCCPAQRPRPAGITTSLRSLFSPLHQRDPKTG